jgi:hypothetical protein
MNWPQNLYGHSGAEGKYIYIASVGNRTLGVQPLVSEKLTAGNSAKSDRDRDTDWHFMFVLESEPT